MDQILVEKKLIATIEELSLNAWPASQTILYDGWILRFADGYTKRANSVNPIYFSTEDVDKKIDFCESLYQQRNLPVVFKMTSAVHPTNLDEILTAKDYQFDSPTSVQTTDLSALNMQDSAEVDVYADLSDTWLENFCRMSAVAERHQNSLHKILTNIVPNRCFAAIRAHGKIVACGLGVLQSGYLGLFDIVTDPDFRRRGYGRQIVTSILTWGQQNGAQTCYLQVMLNNPPALSLYATLGFTERYRYWYRIRS